MSPICVIISHSHHLTRPYHLSILNAMKKALISLCLLLIDQLAKYAASSSSHLFTTPSAYLLGIISWHPTFNYGVTFSWLHHLSPYSLCILQMITVVYLYYLSPPKTAWVWLFAGAISNILDRVTYGYVVDYIALKLFGYSWPTIINLADLYLTIGVIHWLYHTYCNSLNITGNFGSRKLQSDEV